MRKGPWAENYCPGGKEGEGAVLREIRLEGTFGDEPFLDGTYAKRRGNYTPPSHPHAYPAGLQGRDALEFIIICNCYCDYINPSPCGSAPLRAKDIDPAATSTRRLSTAPALLKVA